MQCSKVYATGIIVSLWVYGLLQERIMSQPYDGQMFGDSVLLICNHCNQFADWVHLTVQSKSGVMEMDSGRMRQGSWYFAIGSLQFGALGQLFLAPTAVHFCMSSSFSHLIHFSMVVALDTKVWIVDGQSQSRGLEAECPCLAIHGSELRLQSEVGDLQVHESTVKIFLRAWWFRFVSINFVVSTANNIIPFEDRRKISTGAQVFVERFSDHLPVRSIEICDLDAIRAHLELHVFSFSFCLLLILENHFVDILYQVSFPVQMLGKSFKMMPVMLWGIVISYLCSNHPIQPSHENNSSTHSMWRVAHLKRT